MRKLRFVAAVLLISLLVIVLPPLYKISVREITLFLTPFLSHHVHWRDHQDGRHTHWNQHGTRHFSKHDSDSSLPAHSHEHRNRTATIRKFVLAKDVMEIPEMTKNLTGALSQDNYCADTVDNKAGGHVEMWLCHGQGRNQEFVFTTSMQIVGRHEVCFSALSETGAPIILRTCDHSIPNQIWIPNLKDDTFHLKAKMELCLDSGIKSGLSVQSCDPSKASQKWTLIQTDLMYLKLELNGKDSKREKAES